MPKMIKVSSAYRELEDFEGTISSVIKKLQKLLDKYGNDAEIKLGWGYEGCIDYTVYYKRPENEAERKNRLAKEKARRELQKRREERERERELAEYERLKNKYGG